MDQHTKAVSFLLHPLHILLWVKVAVIMATTWYFHWGRPWEIHLIPGLKYLNLNLKYLLDPLREPFCRSPKRAKESWSQDIHVQRNHPKFPHHAYYAAEDLPMNYKLWFGWIAMMICNLRGASFSAAAYKMGINCEVGQVPFSQIAIICNYPLLMLL